MKKNKKVRVWRDGYYRKGKKGNRIWVRGRYREISIKYFVSIPRSARK